MKLIVLFQYLPSDLSYSDCFNMFLEILVIVMTYVVYKLYQIRQKQRSYWKNLGVKCPPITFPIGNNPTFHPKRTAGKLNRHDICREQYHLMKGEKFYGTYVLGSPNLVNIILLRSLRFKT